MNPMRQLLDGEAVEKSARQRPRPWLVVRLPPGLQSERKTHQSPLCPAVPTATTLFLLLNLNKNNHVNVPPGTIFPGNINAEPDA